MNRQTYTDNNKRLARRILLLWLLALVPLLLQAQQLTDRYNKDRPIVIVGDWDKPPYEFLNDKGQPSGTNIDVMRNILEKQLGIPVRFVLKEWGNALKTFERGDADLILANVRRYDKPPYVVTQNIINYNRICVAMVGDTTSVVSMKRLLTSGVVLKPNDYTAFFFRDLDSIHADKVEFQSPKVALTGLTTGDNKYFIWGEEPLKWKIKELNLEGIILNDVSIPVSEIHVIGRDRELIYEIDDLYSRLKQSGEVEKINNRWLHPGEDNPMDDAIPTDLLLVLAAILLAAVFFLLTRLARVRVREATRTATEKNEMMLKALHMGNFHITEYNIARNLMTNRYGQLLPEEGMTLEEFTRRIHPHEQEEFRKKMALIMGGRTRKFELDKRWNVGTDEKPLWLSFRGHAIVELDSEGRPEYIINAIHDVTSNMEEDHAARSLVRKYDQLLQQSPIAMSFYDKDGWLIELNDTMKTLCGFDGSPDAERFWRTVCMFDIPLFRNLITPEDRDELLVCQHMHYPEIGVDRYIEFHVCPLFDKDGELVTYFISTIDMTEERERSYRIQQQFKEIMKADGLISQYEQNLRYLLENSKAYIWRTDFKERKTYYARSLREDMYVQTCEEYLEGIHPDQKDEIANLLTKPDYLDEVYTYMVHFSYTPYSDKEQWEFVAGKINYDENGEVYEHVGVVRDVTELINARRQLKEVTERAENSSRQKSAFLASMTHELRTPLNSIVGFSDLLGSVETPEERREFIRIIRSNCDMLLRLINDILEASSIDEGPDSITPVKVDFVEAFNDICLTLAKRVQEPGVEFIKDNPYDSYNTFIDIGRIQQVFTNFVTNAVKYTHQGHIRVGYRAEKRAVAAGGEKPGLYIYCEDTGSGIPKDKQEVVFERFVKLDEFVQGTGLGLAICKSIAERFGGTIGVSSEGEGKGSTFWVWVPCEKLED